MTFNSLTPDLLSAANETHPVDQKHPGDEDWREAAHTRVLQQSGIAGNHADMLLRQHQTGRISGPDALRYAFAFGARLGWYARGAMMDTTDLDGLMSDEEWDRIRKEIAS